MSSKCRHCGTFTIEGNSCVGCGASFSLLAPQSICISLEKAGAFLKIPGQTTSSGITFLGQGASEDSSKGQLIVLGAIAFVVTQLVLLSKAGMAARWLLFILGVLFLFVALTYVLGCLCTGLSSAIAAYMRGKDREGSLLAHERSLEKALPENIQCLKLLNALPLKTDQAREENQKLIENLTLIIKKQAIALYLVKIDRLFLELAEIVYNPAHTSPEEYQQKVKQIQTIKARVYTELRRIQAVCPKNIVHFEADVEDRMFDMKALCEAKIEELTLTEAHRISGDMKLLENRELASVVINTRQYKDLSSHFWLKGQAEIVKKWEQTEAHYNTLGEARIIGDTEEKQLQ
ncbi:MAG: hypothetical protein ACAI35_15250 [Candidatus Methylacidiphilales bacterium]|nr:hypothetical protein [Candidatus Methylacidiphilales bacterium]